MNDKNKKYINMVIKLIEDTGDTIESIYLINSLLSFKKIDIDDYNFLLGVLSGYFYKYMKEV